MPRFPSHPQIFDAAAFGAETAQIAALASLANDGPGTAHQILRRISRAAEVAGEAGLPFKHATIYAVLHELEFAGAIARAPYGRQSHRTYEIAIRGRSWLAEAQERWRAAYLVIRAAAAPREISA